MKSEIMFLPDNEIAVRFVVGDEEVAILRGKRDEVIAALKTAWIHANFSLMLEG